jgi:uncharacterized RDD family membrane protein YckC
MKYAGFWARLVAHFIDGALLMMASWLALLSLLGSYFWLKRLGLGLPEEVGPLAQQILLWVFYTLLSAPYYVIGHHRYGTTLGKRSLALYVRKVSEPESAITLAQSVGRYVSYAISSLPLGAGYLLAAVHPRKQALHDLIAGTVVVLRT